MARARLSAMQQSHTTSEGTLCTLEEAIGDKEKQITQLREQRDRAERDKAEERELHERELAEYKMKLQSLNSDLEKAQVRLERALAEKTKLEAKLESSQSDLGKARAELDKIQSEVGKSSSDWESARYRVTKLELENEKLKAEVERYRDQDHYGAANYNAMGSSGSIAGLYGSRRERDSSVDRHRDRHASDRDPGNERDRRDRGGDRSRDRSRDRYTSDDFLNPIFLFIDLIIIFFS
jgi:chromosome segregation ATPase